MHHKVVKYHRQSPLNVLRNLSRAASATQYFAALGIYMRGKERSDMSYQSETRKVVASLLCMLMLSMALPFSLAGTVAATPLGVILTTGTANVGRNSAPTGTSLFSGDRITASNDPVLINFSSGSRIQMTNAAATFATESRRLIVQASHGLFRFRFTGTDGVQIDAGKYRFLADNKMARAGELGVNQNGEVAMTVSQGEFTMINLTTGAQSKVTAEKPLLAASQATKPKAGMSGKTIAALVAGAGGGAAAIGLTLPKPKPKSPSSR
jgi:hypothetical protein